jgi:hypothetical protein
MNAIRHIARVAAVTAIWAAGCANTATCDPGQQFKNGLCLPAPAAKPASDAGVDADVPVTCTPDAALTGEFNRKCTVHSDCACPAPVCAVPPGQTDGFCTRTCPTDPSVCPANFRCIDLSAIDPSYPKTCLPSGLTP